MDKALLKRLNFEFQPVLDQDTQKWYAYSGALQVSIEPPQSVQNMIAEYAKEEQDDAFLAMLIRKPNWIYDTNAYLSLPEKAPGFSLSNDDLMDIIEEQQEDMER